MRTKGRRPELVLLVEEHLAVLEQRRFSRSTLEHRRLYLERFLAWCRAQKITSATHLEPARLGGLAGWLVRKGSGWEKVEASLRDHLVAVRVFCRWLLREGHVTADLAEGLDLPKERRRLPRALTEAEIELVLSQPDVRRLSGLRARTAMEVLYATGMRRSELLALRWDDIDREGGTVLIRGGKGGKDRVVPISGRALSWLERYASRCRRYDERVLPMSPGGLGNLIQRQVEAAGLAGRGQCHLFRHTAATLMLEHGADTRAIQEMLGHAKLSTTQVYTRVGVTELKKAHARAHPGRADEES